MIYLKSKFVIPLLLILGIYFLLRFQQLQSIPVFGDEAIYLRWSQLIKNVETLRFVPQSDGKQPLFMWITTAMYKFVDDPLQAGRIVSIIAGSVILTSLYLFSLVFLTPQIAIISAIVYLALPFSFFFDRLALPDTLLSAFGIISMFFAFLLAKYPRLDLSLILGFFLGLAWLTKSPAIYFIVLTFITYILFNISNYRKIYFPILSSIIAFGMYNILRLGPQFGQIALRNRDYIWSFSEIIKHPLDPLVPHLKDIFTIYSQYISIPLLVAASIGLFLTIKNKKISNIYVILFLWWFLPLIMNSAVAKVFTARYILFTLPPLIILISFGLSQLLTRIKPIYRYLLLLLILLPNLFWISQISTTPFTVKLSSTEAGYTTSWTSGWGIKESSKYLIDRSLVANVIVGTEGYFGTLPDGLQIYTDSLPRLTIFGVGLNLVKVPDKLLDAHNHGDEVYLLINTSRLKLTPDQQILLEKIMSFPKPDNDSLVLYKVVAKI